MSDALADIAARLLSCRRLLNAADSATRVSVWDPEGGGGGTSSDDAARLGDFLRDACTAFRIRPIEPVRERIGATGVAGVVGARLGGPGAMQAASRALAAPGSDPEATIQWVESRDPRYTFEARSMRAPDGSPIEVYSRGAKESPAWVVVLPYGVPVEVLFGFADYVSSEYRFVAIEGADLLSDPDEFEELAHGIDPMAGRILAALDQSDLAGVHLTGICGSAMATVRFASRHPDRVRSLILGNGAYSDATRAASGMSEMIRSIGGNRAKAAVLCRFMQAQDLTRLEPDCPHLTMVPYVNRDLLYKFATASKALADDTPGEAEFEEWLARIACPCLVIVCERDTIVGPEGSHQVAGKLKHCRKVVDENGTHLSLLSSPSPDVVRAMVEFCKQHDLEGGSGGTS